MRLLKRLLVTLVVLIAILAAASFLLPRNVTVARTTTIEAPADQVFAHLNSLQAQAAWSPWLNIDPDMVQTYSGPDAGVGNRLDWTSDHPNVGNGSQEIIEMTENESVTTALDFGAQGTANAALLLAASGDTTEVTWTLETDMGNNPIGRYMGLMMDGMVGGDYETGLANLKTLVEGG